MEAMAACVRAMVSPSAAQGANFFKNKQPELELYELVCLLR